MLIISHKDGDNVDAELQENTEEKTVIEPGMFVGFIFRSRRMRQLARWVKIAPSVMAQAMHGRSAGPKILNKRTTTATMTAGISAMAEKESGSDSLRSKSSERKNR
ncbi:MAG: hypothetical protein ACLTSZ_11585 [Lachnospiraceae bacterium]